jgi:hypothetical protein
LFRLLIFDFVFCCFRKQFGTLKSFVESRPEFDVNQEKVSVRPPKPVETKKVSKPKTVSKPIEQEQQNDSPSPVHRTSRPSNVKPEKLHKKSNRREESTVDVSQLKPGIPAQAIYILAGVAILVIALGVIKL